MSAAAGRARRDCPSCLRGKRCVAPGHRQAKIHIRAGHRYNCDAHRAGCSRRRRKDAAAAIEAAIISTIVLIVEIVNGGIAAPARHTRRLRHNLHSSRRPRQGARLRADGAGSRRRKSRGCPRGPGPGRKPPGPMTCCAGPAKPPWPPPCPPPPPEPPPPPATRPCANVSAVASTRTPAAAAAINPVTKRMRTPFRIEAVRLSRDDPKPHEDGTPSSHPQYIGQIAFRALPTKPACGTWRRRIRTQSAADRRRDPKRATG